MDVAIAGGGASGMLCAVSVKQRNPEIGVTVYERLPKTLKKLLATGNGKCNLTNMQACAQHYYEAAAFTAPALEKFSPCDTVAYFKSLGLLCFEENEGRVYPTSRSAQSAAVVLRNKAKELGVQIYTDTEITSLQRQNRGFLLNKSFFADKVVFACGGAAAPDHGTDGTAFALLSGLGHTVTALQPALTAVKIKGFPHSLKGVRQICRVELLFNGHKVYGETGELQFTDYGLSGIPIMQLSRFITQQAEPGAFVVKLDCLPQMDRQALTEFLLQQKTSAPADEAVSGILPRQLGSYIQLLCGIRKDTPFCDVTPDKIRLLAEKIKALLLPVDSLRAFQYAQVTKGGAVLREFDSHTMQSKLVKGLYAVGEALDVDGPCGGYNLQWAWSSAQAAAEAITKEMQN